jgi:hypothetical protein
VTALTVAVLGPPTTRLSSPNRDGASTTARRVAFPIRPLPLHLDLALEEEVEPLADRAFADDRGSGLHGEELGAREQALRLPPGEGPAEMRGDHVHEIHR